METARRERCWNMASLPLLSKAKGEELGFAYCGSAMENHMREKEKNWAQKEEHNLNPSFKGKQSGLLLLESITRLSQSG